MFDLHPVSTLPSGAKQFTPKWSERILEWSLLRSPGVLARAIGVQDQTGLTALKQISQIDLYLRVPHALHLIEIKKPSQHKHRHWRGAATEIIRQWQANEVWLRPNRDPVHLWTLCPVDPKLCRAPDYAQTIAALEEDNRTRLSGRLNATFGMLRYAVFKRRHCYLVIWRADEQPPALPGLAS